MTDNTESAKLFANDGTNWRSTRSPVSATEAREADAKLDEAAAGADGPSATNETRLSHTIVEGSNESSNPAAEQAAEEEKSDTPSEEKSEEEEKTTTTSRRSRKASSE